MKLFRSVFTRLAIAAIALSACGDTLGRSSSDDAAQFVGRWTYLAGSSVVINCPGQPPVVTDLSKVPPTNQPAFFVFSEVSLTRVHEIDARGCEYDWTIAGSDAVGVSGQSCDKFPDGRGGATSVTLVDGVKSTRDGRTMAVAVNFQITQAACTAAVRGTAVKTS